MKEEDATMKTDVAEDDAFDGQHPQPSLEKDALVAGYNLEVQTYKLDRSSSTGGPFRLDDILRSSGEILGMGGMVWPEGQENDGSKPPAEEDKL